MTKRLQRLTLDYFRQQGAKGGRKAAQTSTPEQRSARATKASLAAAAKRTEKAKEAKG